MMSLKQDGSRMSAATAIIAVIGLSLSALALALGAPTTTRVFSGQEISADPLPPAQPYSSPSLVGAGDPSNPLFDACQLYGPVPYTANVNSNYNLANCFGPHPSGQALTFSSSGCNGLSPDGSFSPTTQVASCYVSAQVPASGNSLASSVVVLDLAIAGALQSQTITPTTPAPTTTVQVGSNYQFSLNGAATSVSYAVADTSVCQVSVSGLVTPQSPGLCSVTATAARDASNDEASHTVSFTVDYQAQPTLAAFDSSSLNWSANAASLTPAVAGWQGSSTPTWVSADPSVCTVATDGTVTRVADGSCSITASIVSDGTYAAATETFTFTVQMYSAPAVSTTAIASHTYIPFISTSLSLSEAFDFDNAENGLTYSGELAGGGTLASVGLSIDATSGAITGTVLPSAGNFSVEVTGTDSRSAAATHTVAFTSTALPTNRQAQYQTNDFAIGSQGYEFRSWDDGHTGITYVHPNRVDPPSGRYVAISEDGTSAVASRLTIADMLAQLGASNLTVPAFNSAGLRRNDGELLTIAASSSDTAGYLVIGAATRDGYSHGLLHVVPLPGTTTAHTSSGNSVQVSNLYLAQIPYGFERATSSNVTGNVAITGDTTIGSTLTADMSAVSDPDGYELSRVSYQWLRGGQAIDGATQSTYTLGSADNNQTVSLRATYTDNRYFEEQLTSNPTATVAYASGSSPLTVQSPVTLAQLTSMGLSSGLQTELSDPAYEVCGPGYDQSCLVAFNTQRLSTACPLVNPVTPTTAQLDEYVQCVIHESQSALSRTRIGFNTPENSCHAGAHTVRMPAICSLSQYTCTASSVPSGATFAASIQPNSGLITGIAARTNARNVDYTIQVSSSVTSSSFTQNYRATYGAGGQNTQRTVVYRINNGGLNRFYAADVEQGRLWNFVDNYRSNQWNFDNSRLATKSELETALGGSFANTGSVLALFRNTTPYNFTDLRDCSSGSGMPYSWQTLNQSGLTGSEQTANWINFTGQWVDGDVVYVDDLYRQRSSTSCGQPQITPSSQGTVVYAMTDAPTQVCPALAATRLQDLQVASNSHSSAGIRSGNNNFEANPGQNIFFTHTSGQLFEFEKENRRGSGCTLRTQGFTVNWGYTNSIGSGEHCRVRARTIDEGGFATRGWSPWFYLWRADF